MQLWFAVWIIKWSFFISSIGKSSCNPYSTQCIQPVSILDYLTFNSTHFRFYTCTLERECTNDGADMFNYVFRNFKFFQPPGSCFWSCCFISSRKLPVFQVMKQGRELDYKQICTL